MPDDPETNRSLHERMTVTEGTPALSHVEGYTSGGHNKRAHGQMLAGRWMRST